MNTSSQRVDSDLRKLPICSRATLSVKYQAFVLDMGRTYRLRLFNLAHVRDSFHCVTLSLAISRRLFIYLSIRNVRYIPRESSDPHIRP